MEWLLGLFVITSVWALWVVPVVFFFIVLAFAENEKNFWAFISVAVFAAIFYHSGLLILNDPWTIAKYFGMYFIAGAVWSIIKWYFFIGEKAKEFGELKLRYIKKMNVANGDNYQLPLDIKTEFSEKEKDSFKAWLLEQFGYYELSHKKIDAKTATISEIVIPAASRYKEKITTWILWWPTSAFWTILNDPLVKLANAIYDRFQGIYTRIANKAFAKFEV